MPKTLLFATCTTCCWRMFDVQLHKVLSQVFMPFCEHAQNPAICGAFASFVWRSHLIPKRTSWITWGKCAIECPKFESLDFLKHEPLHFHHTHTNEVL